LGGMRERGRDFPELPLAHLRVTVPSSLLLKSCHQGKPQNEHSLWTDTLGVAAPSQVKSGFANIER